MYKSDSTKLIVLCQRFYPELVSTGQTMTEICEVLSEMGVDIEVVCGFPTLMSEMENVPKNLDYKNIKIHRVWNTSFPKINLLGRIINQITFTCTAFFYLLFKNEKVPILVTTLPPFLGIICGILNKIKKVPFIYLVFDVYPETAIKLEVIKQDSFIARLWNYLNDFTLNRAKEIIVIGRCMQEIIQKKLEKSKYSNLNLIHVWGDDISIQNTDENKDYFKNEWELENKFVVLYSGNMGRFHDMETLLAAANILKSNKDIEFLFVGEGYKKKWIQEYINEHILKNCQVHSYVPRKDLGCLIKTADVGLVSLNLGQEGLSVPSKTFGLMAAGLPILAIMSPKAEIARIVQENECGLVLEPGKPEKLAKAITELANNKKQSQKFGANARRAIKSKYNLKAAAEAYYKLIK